ncbi:MAG: hypothetical protein FJ189_02070 [Gammaproteobacteria bacterium]|nr:hypothetical protein [Gammaproteobacteria bacterium]
MAANSDPLDHAVLNGELERLRVERDRLLRLLEEQSATARLLAAKPSQHVVWWFLMSLSLLVVLVLMLVAWFYFYQLEPVGDGIDSGTCARWSPLTLSRAPAGSGQA